MDRWFILILIGFGTGIGANFWPAGVAPASAAELRSFDDISRLMTAPEGPRTVEEFLRQVRDRRPELFAGFTLMRESQSLQGASPDAPRAIVFGADARLVLTFNGRPDQAGYHHVELMQFVQTSEHQGFFELREIQFATDGKAAAVLSEANPPKCARCHGTHPKPLWEEYDRWPGAYGEDDDALIDFDQVDRYPPMGDQDSALVKRHRQHLAEFRAFKQLQPSHGRYRYLQFPEGTESPVAPYIPRGRTGKDPLRPNLRLTKLFAELNAKKLALDFVNRSGQCFSQGAPVAVALMIGCENFATSQPTISAVSAALNQHQKSAPWPVALEPALFSLQNPRFYQNGMVHLLQLMGFSDFDWSPARVKRQWQYFQGFVDASDGITGEVWPHLQELGLTLPAYEFIRAQRFPEYYKSPYRPSSDGGSDDGTTSDGRDGFVNYWELACKGLLDGRGAFSPAHLAESCQSQKIEPTVPAVIKMCMSCHNGASEAPMLPLDDAVRVGQSAGLKELIMSRINHHDPSMRMPPDRPMTVFEYSDIVNFYDRHDRD